MKIDLAQMQTIEIIESIDPRELQSYLRDGSFRTARYPKNGTVHFVGERCSTLEIILSGTVGIERIDESGHLMTIAEFMTGDILGGSLLFSKNPYYPMTATAKQPAVILEISRDRLFSLFSNNHEFLKSFLQYTADHTVILGDRIRHYVNRTIRESVVSYLHYERKKQNSDTIRLPMTKKALAEKIGVQRTSLSRELAKMRAEGYIEYDAGTVTLSRNFPPSS